MEYILYFSEHNSFKDDNAVRSNEEDDGWFENEYEIPFTAETLEEAKEIAQEKCDTSSGVFNVYQNGKLIFTEENL